MMGLLQNMTACEGKKFVHILDVKFGKGRGAG